MGVNTNQKKLFQIVVAIAAVIQVIACFLPFATVSVLGFSQSITWADGDGIFAIILAVLAAVMVFLNRNVTYIIAMVAAAINAILIIYDGFIGYASQMSELGDYSGMVSRGAGIYIFINKLHKY